MDELLPLFEREGIALNLEPAPRRLRGEPRGWPEPGARHRQAVGEVRLLRSAHLPRLERQGQHGGRCSAAPATSSPTYTSRTPPISSGLRYILIPPGTPARVHQHLDIGQGEVDWDDLFSTLRDLNFDGIATVAVLAWGTATSIPSPSTSTASGRSWTDVHCGLVTHSGVGFSGRDPSLKGRT